MNIAVTMPRIRDFICTPYLGMTIKLWQKKGIMLKRILFMLIIASGVATPSYAANQYNANSSHRILHVLTYTYDTTILFYVNDMPVIANCPGNYFIIPGDANMDSRHQILSRLLTAYSTKESINIGYDGSNCGPGGYIMVYRVG